MNKNIISIIVLLTASTLIYPQEILKLFEKDLCNEIKNNSEVANLVERNLNAVKSIHPELIYFYITAYNEQFGNITIPTDNFDNTDLVFIKNDYLKKINDWYNLQIQYLKNNELNSHLYNIEKNYFEQRMPAPPIELKKTSDKIIKYDKNMMDYYVYKYYTGSAEIDYNIYEGYLDMRNNFEKKMIDRFMIYEKQLSYAEISTDQADLYFPEMISYWHLFTSEYLNTFVGNFIKNRINNPYMVNKINAHQIRLTTGTKIGELGQFNYELLIKDTDFSITNIDHKVSYFQFSGGLGYTYNFREVDGILSKIDLDFLFSYQRLNSFFMLQDFGEKPPQTYHEDIYDYELLDFSNSMIKMNSLFSYSLLAKVPLFYFYDKFSITVGGCLDYSILNYSEEFSYVYKKLRAHYNYYDYLSSITTVRTINEVVPLTNKEINYTRFYPLIGAEYNPVDNLFININFYMKYVVLKVGYCVI